jgi:RsiW-degrading membrane proteinase PrsW (M82 family)
MPYTELCPPVSPTKTSRRHLILPLGCTAVLFILLVVLRDGGTKGHLLASYGLFWVFYIVYVISGTKTNPVVYFVPALIVVAEFITPFATPFFYLFRTILPGSASSNPTLVQTFVGSGLMEELMKSLPALIGLYLAKRLTTSNSPASGYLSSFRCSTPIEGMLIGLAAGAGFVYVDVCYHVVPSSGIYEPNAEYPEISPVGFILLSQRVLSGVVSHIFWTSISGFFIGLCARHSRNLVPLLLAAWLVPAALHTFWNLSPHLGNEGRWLKVVLSSATFLVCFAIARKPGPRGHGYSASS